MKKKQTQIKVFTQSRRMNPQLVTVTYKPKTQNNKNAYKDKRYSFSRVALIEPSRPTTAIIEPILMSKLAPK